MSRPHSRSRVGCSVEQLAQPRDEVAMTTLPQLEVGLVLNGRQAQLGEPSCLGLEVRRVPDVLERLAAPEGQRLLEARLGGARSPTADASSARA